MVTPTSPPVAPAPTSDPAVDAAGALAAAVRQRVESVLRGKPEPVTLALVALLSGGHLLVEDVPGVGKTLLAKSLARAVGGSFRRVQCTPDLLPTELTGVSVFHLAGNEWEFRPGPLFANVVLVDELNRATPRTQSALLEAMEEHQVTVDGISRPLPHPFFLVATQNPFETTGTFPLVEGQLDRFAVVTNIGPPDADTERALLLGEGGEDALSGLMPVADAVTLADAIATTRRIHCAPAVADYVIAIAHTTRANPDIAIGASPTREPGAPPRRAGPRAPRRSRLRGAGRREAACGPGARAPARAARPRDAARGAGLPPRARRRRPGPAPVNRRLPAPSSLSLPGIVLALVAAALYLIARSTGAGWDVVILSGLVSVLVLGAIWPGLTLPTVRARVTAPADAMVGRPLLVQVDLRGRSSALRMRVRFDRDGGSDWIHADAPGRGDLMVAPAHRGVVDTVMVEVHSAGPLGLVGWRKRLRVALDTAVDVAPRPMVTRYAPASGAQPVVRADPHAGARGQETTRGVRDYVDGDPIRLVHWPSTARTGTVMVRELEGPEQPRLLIVVDLRGARSEAEFAASRASGLAIAALGSGVRVDLATAEAHGPVTGPVRTASEVGRRLARAVSAAPTPPPTAPGVDVRRIRPGVQP